ncbi:MAG: 16S rRNA (guanine(527)-N(7))-methyltransferase RsmG [Nitrospirae bacterium]|nr:MAG: 16S rRNA (guanine(527)-N(7))-methyltransferase RsmG [Nitrospirota bacterium]
MSPNPSAPDLFSPAAALMEGGLRLGIPLSPHTVARLVRYLQELMRWSARVNLTGLITERDIISKHFLDSLAAVKLIKPDLGLIRPGPGLRVLDVGTGAGFPGLVLKLQDPDLAVTLLEPSQKKAAFLHHMIGLLGISGVAVLIARLEDLDPVQTGPFDLVTSRAVRPELILTEAPRLLARGGRVLLFRVSPMEQGPSGYRLIQEASFALPFTDDPRTLTLLEPAVSSS